jgi:succinate dehydrogenase/fumarate reductase cytochrome b subunit
MTEQAKQRPEFRNINFSDLPTYRLPLAGIVSILHRVSGLMFDAAAVHHLDVRQLDLVGNFV